MAYFQSTTNFKSTNFQLVNLKALCYKLIVFISNWKYVLDFKMFPLLLWCFLPWLCVNIWIVKCSTFFDIWNSRMIFLFIDSLIIKFMIYDFHLWFTSFFSEYMKIKDFYENNSYINLVKDGTDMKKISDKNQGAFMRRVCW